MKRKLFSIFIVLLLFATNCLSTLAAEKVYVVRRGDNLWRICKKHKVQYKYVLKANPNISNPRKIFRGQKIIIPSLDSMGNYKPPTNQPQLQSGSNGNQKTPTPPAPAPRSDSSGVSSGDMTKQVVDLVNKERVSRGLQPLTIDAKLKECAQAKAQDMVDKNYFSHTSPTYGSPFNMMEQWGIKFTAAGENIAEGQRTAQEVMTSWMNSPGHRSNILSNSFSEIGVGVAKDKNGVLYWSQMFMRPAIGH